MGLFLSPYVLAAVLAWCAAQGLKYLIVAFKSRDQRSIKRLYLSGGMPSAHTSSAIGLLLVIGLKDGVGSGLFGLALLFTAVVMYDAVMVRRSSGEQGTALQGLFSQLKLKPIAQFRTAKGHNGKEVIVGAIVGAAVGIVVYFATLS